MATTQRRKDRHETAPRITERGHLSLVEWSADAAPTRKLTPPPPRASADRLYAGGILLLMLACALAALVSFARL